MDYAFNPFMVVKQRLRHSARQWLLCSAIAFVVILVASRPTSYDAPLFFAVLVFSLPAGALLWFIYRFFRFVLDR